MQKKTFMEKIYPIEIEQDGRSVSLKGYWDSGNLLMDPFVLEPVQIIGKHTVEQLFGEELPPVRLIPFRTLGNENGLLPVCTAQRMYIYEGTQKKEIVPVVLGMADKDLLDGKEYDVILQTSMIGGEIKEL